MEITERREGAVAVLALEGRLDGEAERALVERVAALLDGGLRKIALDCGNLDYVSSAGLRALLLALRRVKSADGALAMGAVRDQVRQVLEMTGFAPHFAIHPRIEDATRALAGPG